jgi:hypothetical protein
MKMFCAVEATELERGAIMSAPRRRKIALCRAVAELERVGASRIRILCAVEVTELRGAHERDQNENLYHYYYYYELASV